MFSSRYDLITSPSLFGDLLTPSRFTHELGLTEGWRLPGLLYFAPFVWGASTLVSALAIARIIWAGSFCTQPRVQESFFPKSFSYWATIHLTRSRLFGSQYASSFSCTTFFVWGAGAGAIAGVGSGFFCSDCGWSAFFGAGFFTELDCSVAITILRETEFVLHLSQLWEIYWVRGVLLVFQSDFFSSLQYSQTPQSLKQFYDLSSWLSQ